MQIQADDIAHLVNEQRLCRRAGGLGRAAGIQPGAARNGAHRQAVQRRPVSPQLRRHADDDVAAVADDVAARGRHNRELDGELGRPDAAPAFAQAPSAKLPPRRQNQDEQLRPKTPQFRREEGLSDWHCS